MKIAYCIQGIYNSGGMERILSIKANYLVEHFGYDIIIITSDQKSRKPFFELNDKIKLFDLDINYCDYRDRNILYRKLCSNKKYLHKKRLTELLNKEEVDIVVSMFDDDVSILPKIKCDAAKILEYHFCRYSRICREGKGKFLNPYVRYRDNKNIAQYDKFIVLTEEDKQWWNEHDNVTVIYNPLTIGSTQTAMLHNKIVCSVGRLHMQKGYDRLIPAWAKVHQSHPDWKLQIYGCGPLYDKIHNQINQSGLEDSILLKEPTKNIDDVYANSSVYVMSSRYEGMPLVLIEAMSVGLPCVSFDFPCGPKEIIQDGVTGIIAPNGDIDKLANGIIKLIENEELRKTMGCRAKADVFHRFNIDNVMSQWRMLFEELLKK